MKIEKGKVVLMHYTLKNDKGDVLDSSIGKEPLGFIHGHGQLISGLEYVLTGKKKGEKFTTVVQPEDAYGDKQNDLIQQIPLSQFDNKDAVKVGVQFQTNGPDQAIATVIAVDKEEATVDLNHPLAGQELYFDIDVQEVRDATQEEVDHGHVHGKAGETH
tara:strand:- start:3342 stop:3821 length:480 start_codon:yes stop_codon:yes gene_type:complete